MIHVLHYCITDKDGNKVKPCREIFVEVPEMDDLKEGEFFNSEETHCFSKEHEEIVRPYIGRFLTREEGLKIKEALEKATLASLEKLLENKENVSAE